MTTDTSRWEKREGSNQRFKKKKNPLFVAVWSWFHSKYLKGFEGGFGGKKMREMDKDLDESNKWGQNLLKTLLRERERESPHENLKLPTFLSASTVCHRSGGCCEQNTAMCNCAETYKHLPFSASAIYYSHLDVQTSSLQRGIHH